MQVTLKLFVPYTRFSDVSHNSTIHLILEDLLRLSMRRHCADVSQVLGRWKISGGVGHKQYLYVIEIINFLVVPQLQPFSKTEKLSVTP